MNQLTKYILYACLMIIIMPCKMFSQNTALNDQEEEKLIIAAREIMEASGTCALITLDEELIPMVRIMDPFPPENDFTVWFGTKAESRKVNQILNNPDVSLYYQDSDASGYVVIHGKAQIIDDQIEKQKRWKDAWEDFYPNKREGYLLIKVSPEWMEILSVTRGINGDQKTWQTPIVQFD